MGCATTVDTMTARDTHPRPAAGAAGALTRALQADRDALLATLEPIYCDLHRHPELSMRERRTAEVAADHVERLGFDVTRGVGGTGVVAVLRNGSGPTVMLRADMDALPVTEESGLPYAATGVKAVDDEGVEVGVSHACGHDMHVTWLVGVGHVLANHRDAWRGTVLLVFQPGEEIAAGARAMVDDWGDDRFPKPDVILGQHVMNGAAGTVSYRPGVTLSAGDGLRVRLFGRGGHGSMPHTTVDPVVMAAATVMRLQTVVSREIDPQESAVLTIGALHVGTKENIIPEVATLKLNLRSYDEATREHMLGSIRRICCAECDASGAPRAPEFTPLYHFPLTENDRAATERVGTALQAELGDQVSVAPRPTPASEDFSIFGRSWQVPSVFWFVGGTEPDQYRRHQAEGTLRLIPGNHSPRFAPVIHPTLETGLRSMLAAASAWLEPDGG
jgi:amidohydrolase